MLAEPFDVMDAGRMAVLADTEGAVFCVWQAKDHRGATVVNEHGAVNFNGLACRDVAAAERFYGAVFGWKQLPLAERLRCGRCPGTATTSRRRRRGSASRWRGWARPTGSSTSWPSSCRSPTATPTTHPHWSVTFATDDVEATAATARELGGEVVEGPHDAPWVRMAVIKDPQGALFIASQFVAENAVL